MKNPLLFFPILVLLTLVRCSENNDPSHEEVVFSVAVSDEAQKNGATEIRGECSLIVTITKDDGKPIMDYEKIVLERSGDHFVSQPIRLPGGAYRIEDLMIEYDGEVTSAAPRRGSTLAPRVEKSLPADFWVSGEESTTIPMSVVEIGSSNPDAFGYTSFRRKAIHPFGIKVYVNHKGRLKPTHANLRIEQGSLVLLHSRILPKVNVFAFTGDRFTTSTLVVSKEGYEDTVIEFNYDLYLREFRGRPLEIILEPEPEASLVAESDIRLFLTCVKSGSLHADWPDGTSEVFTFRGIPTDPDRLSYLQITHALYTPPGNVGLSGDLDQIVEFISDTPLSDIEIARLKNLQAFTLENSSIQTLDLRSNVELTTLGFVNSDFGEILLPEKHGINSITVEGMLNRDHGTALEKLIADVHRNAVANHVTEGAFILFNTGEISEASRQKLADLETAYSWYVEFEPIPLASDLY